MPIKEVSFVNLSSTPDLQISNPNPNSYANYHQNKKYTHEESSFREEISNLDGFQYIDLIRKKLKDLK